MEANEKSILSVKELCLWYGNHQALKNINIDILIIQVTHFLILLTIPSKDISGHIPLMHEIAKLMLINGRIILSAN